MNVFKRTSISSKSFLNPFRNQRNHKNHFYIVSFLLFFLAIQPQYSFAQIKLNKVEANKLVAGKPAVLLLKGKGFKDVKALDLVRIGNHPVEVTSYKILSNKKIELFINVPRQIEPNIYSLFVQFSGPTFKIGLESQFGNKSGPEIELKIKGNIYAVDSMEDLNFGTTYIGKSKLQKFEVHNEGNDTLLLGQLLLSEGFQLDGSFPAKIFPNNVSLFYVKLSAEQAGTFAGMLKFETNDEDENSFNIPISDKVDLFPVPKIKVFADSHQVSAEVEHRVNFISPAAGLPIRKILKIFNEEIDDLQLHSITLPDGFEVIGEFPSSIAAGSTDSIFIEYSPDSAQTINDDVYLYFNNKRAEPYIFKVQAMVQAETILSTSEVNPIIAENSESEAIQPNPFSHLKINVDQQPIQAERTEILNFKGNAQDVPAKKMIYFMNTDSITFLTSIKLKEPFFLLGPMPDQIKPGATDSVLIGFQAQPGTIHTSSIQLTINNTPIYFDVSGEIKQEPPINIFLLLLLVLSLLMLGTVVFFLWPSIVKAANVLKSYKSRKILEAGLNVEFKVSEDFGNPSIELLKTGNTNFELRIKPVIDFGTTEITSAKSKLFNTRNIQRDIHLGVYSKQKDNEDESSDLKRIEGIGPVIQKLLNQSGIISFNQLADSNEKDLRKILQNSKIYYSDPESWTNQARLASEGKWHELDLLQNKLNGGRTVTTNLNKKRQKSVI